ncbi:MAG: hypothetical protein MJD61_21665 [Proteobacteria bacterium]|nr:hypothetical protein [Pseudomonadota bacterium]
MSESKKENPFAARAADEIVATLKDLIRRVDGVGTALEEGKITEEGTKEATKGILIDYAASMRGSIVRAIASETLMKALRELGIVPKDAS